MSGAATWAQEAVVELWAHLYEEEPGYLNTFTGQQARFGNPRARANELTRIKNRTWRFPEQGAEAAEYLSEESRRRRDAYFGVHLYEEHQPGRRLAANAARFVRALWVDGDGAKVPPRGPLPPPSSIRPEVANTSIGRFRGPSPPTWPRS